MRGKHTDPHSLASRMQELQRWLDSSELPATTRSHFFPHTQAVVTIDPASRAPAASLNSNAIRLCANSAITAGELSRMMELFAEAGVRRFFVWLSPGPQMPAIRGWLENHGAKRVPWTRYPTLLHSGTSPAPRPCSLRIRQVNRSDIEKANVPVDSTVLLDGFLSSLDRPGFHHFAAFDHDELVATAALAHFEGMGYLTYAATAQTHRGRGAQSGLIAARVALAQDLRCELILSQTLSMLEHSLANLTRAGFTEVYEKEVYECTDSATPA